MLECDDGYLNDIQAMAVTEAHAFAAIDAAEDEFASGSVGGHIDRLFQAAAEATQEAVLDALAAGETMVGRAGHRRVGLRDVLRRGGEVDRRGALPLSTCADP